MGREYSPEVAIALYGSEVVLPLNEWRSHSSRAVENKEEIEDLQLQVGL
ncbi:hypothetical protein BWQ96_04398 [Gracilariopsis chorda]|uniref:Uncharacterized protein n=1 Tax=Gracilariopsis chorda TaxID=448386 RepID=A0A2V3IUS0_9FLOR|nr:hypothetical protein BWQ96_04398 [Gracilariopsis chorda]|eukprot:PXF45861.1 hypothetical protein BWQ96_04398 [Gracilariopsis chorda]